MMRKDVKNIAASIRARLINIADENKRDYNALLRLYFQERFLYRLSISPYKSKLILKGALFLMMNDVSKFRPTKDIDFLGKAISNEMSECEEVIKIVASVNADDGVEFVVDKIKTERIKEDAEYEGIRIHLPYKMDTIKGYLSIDIGFGDKIVHGPFEMDFPVILDLPIPNIFVYSLESAVAEKFEAIVKLNFLTSRMKDFYDIIFIAEKTQFKKENLREALTVTFKHRMTNIEERFLIYEESYKQNSQKQIQWSSFLDRNKLTSENNFAKVIELIQSFIEPIFTKEKQVWNPNKFIWE
jgi:predicted nucleotidyltransferase component of viral defense system